MTGCAGDLRVDHAVSSGTFSLDGETFDVDNNIWVVGDDDECVVIDAPHSVDDILAVVARPHGEGDPADPRPRRPLPGRARAARGRGSRRSSCTPTTSRSGSSPPTGLPLGPRPARRLGALGRRHDDPHPAHAGPRARAAAASTSPTSAACSPATRSSRAAPEPPAARTPTGRCSRSRSGRGCSRCPTTPSCTPATVTTPRSVPRGRRAGPDAADCATGTSRTANRASERPHQQAGALAVDPGQHDRGLVVAGQREPLAELVGDDVDAALLDGEPADAALVQGRAQRLLAVREDLEDLVGARERRAERRVGGDVGDVPVEQPAADAGRDRGDEARRGSRRRPARRGTGPSGTTSAPGSSSSVSVASPPSPITVARRSVVASRPPHSAASLTSPWSLTHSASTPAGIASWGIPGAVFTHASRGQQRLDERPRRRPGVEGEGAAPAGTPRGVGEGHVERAVVPVVASRDRHGAGQPERGQVGRGDRDPHRVEVDAGGGQPGAREGDQVAADAAAEVDHGRGAERLEPGRAVRGHREPGGLLEPVGGEVHDRGQRRRTCRRLARRSSAWVSAAASSAASVPGTVTRERGRGRAAGPAPRPARAASPSTR